MDFVLLVALTAVYLIRPGDWIQSLSAIPLFQITILSCLALSMESWSKKLNSQSLRENPITLCVIGLLGVVFLSQLLMAPGNFSTTIDFSKACVFYVLIVGVVNSEARLQSYLRWLAIIICVLAVLMIKGQQGSFQLGGELVDVVAKKSYRAEALGGRNFDPNDTAAILLVGVLISGHSALCARGIARRVLWVLFAAVTAYGLKLTDSRGGFLALCLGGAAYVYTRWGPKGLAAGMCVLGPVAIGLASSRMLESGAVSQGTGQARVQLWHTGFVLFKQHPLLGIGPNQFTQVVGKAAHNSFLQAFAELGFVGGSLFIGAFVLGVGITYRVVARHRKTISSDASPDVTLNIASAILIGYAFAIFALNQTYAGCTYLMLAIATCSITLYASDDAANPDFVGYLKQIVLAGVGFLVFIYVAANLLVNW
jgi:O-antigen ligase